MLECWICFEGKVNKVCRKTGCKEGKQEQASMTPSCESWVVERIKLFNEIGNTGR